MTNYSQLLTLLDFLNICGSSKQKEEATKLSNVVVRDGVKKPGLFGVVSKKKKKLMEFSIKLAGWVLDAPVFH